MYTKYYAIESGTWSVNKENTTSMITLEKNDARMVRWSNHVDAGDTISAVKLRNRLQLNIMRECLQKTLLRLDDLQRMEHNVWSSKANVEALRLLVVSARDHGKTWNEVI